MRRVFSLRQSALQYLQRGSELRLDMRLRLQRRQGPGELSGGAVVGVLQGVQRSFNGITQGLGVRQAAVLGVEFFPFVAGRRELIDLADLPGQALLLALQAVLGAAGVFDCLLRCAPGLPALSELAQRDTGKSVQQAAHGVRACQALPSVLAMDVNQLVGNLFELRGGGGAAVDPGPALALRVDGAFEQQFVAGLQAVFFQPLQQRGGAVKSGVDLAALRAFAHHGGVCARAQCQLQCVNQDRLASAGFAGEHGEAPGQVQLERANDHEVAEKNAFQAHDAVLIAVSVKIRQRLRSSAAFCAGCQSSSSRRGARSEPGVPIVAR